VNSYEALLAKGDPQAHHLAGPLERVDLKVGPLAFLFRFLSNHTFLYLFHWFSNAIHHVILFGTLSLQTHYSESEPALLMPMYVATLSRVPHSYAGLPAKTLLLVGEQVGLTIDNVIAPQSSSPNNLN
jgi:hypothetical protein